MRFFFNKLLEFWEWLSDSVWKFFTKLLWGEKREREEMREPSEAVSGKLRLLPAPGQVKLLVCPALVFESEPQTIPVYCGPGIDFDELAGLISFTERPALGWLLNELGGAVDPRLARVRLVRFSRTTKIAEAPAIFRGYGCRPARPFELLFWILYHQHHQPLFVGEIWSYIGPHSGWVRHEDEDGEFTQLNSRWLVAVRLVRKSGEVLFWYMVVWLGVDSHRPESSNWGREERFLVVEE